MVFPIVKQEIIEVIDVDDDDDIDQQSVNTDKEDTTLKGRTDTIDKHGVIDEDALVEIQPKHFRRLDYPPGCPVIRFWRTGATYTVSFGTVKEAFVDMDTGTHVYMLDSGTKCRKKELHYGRDANVWVEYPSGTKVAGVILNSRHASGGSEAAAQYCVKLEDGEQRNFLAASAIKYRSPEARPQEASAVQAQPPGVVVLRNDIRRQVSSETITTMTSNEATPTEKTNRAESIATTAELGVAQSSMPHRGGDVGAEMKDASQEGYISAEKKAGSKREHIATEKKPIFQGKVSGTDKKDAPQMGCIISKEKKTPSQATNPPASDTPSSCTVQGSPTLKRKRDPIANAMPANKIARKHQTPTAKTAVAQISTQSAMTDTILDRPLASSRTQPPARKSAVCNTPGEDKTSRDMPCIPMGKDASLLLNKPLVAPHSRAIQEKECQENQGECLHRDTHITEHKGMPRTSPWHERNREKSFLDLPLGAARERSTPRQSTQERDNNHDTIDRHIANAATQAQSSKLARVVPPMEQEDCNGNIRRDIVIPRWVGTKEVKDTIIGPGGVYHKRLTAATRCQLRLKGYLVESRGISCVPLYIDAWGRREDVGVLTSVVLKKIAESAAEIDMALVMYQLARDNPSFSILNGEAAFVRIPRGCEKEEWVCGYELRATDDGRVVNKFIGRQREGLKSIGKETKCWVTVRTASSRRHILISGPTAGCVNRGTLAVKERLKWCRRR